MAPTDTSELVLLAERHEQAGNLEEAEAAFLELARAEPKVTRWHEKIAAICERLGRKRDALVKWIDVLLIDPFVGKAAFEAGRLQFELGHFEQGAEMLRHCQKLMPDHPLATLHLAQCLAEMGQCREARDELMRVFQASRLDGLLVRRLFLLPVIYESAQALREWRAGFRAELAALLDRPPAIDNPVAQVGSTPFYLAYQGEDDRQLMAQCARLFSRVPRRSAAPRRMRGPRRRLALVSRFLTPGHTIGRIFSGLFRSLDPRRFEVIECPIVQDAAAIASVPSIHPDHRRVPLLASDYFGACDALIDESPDIVFYPDLGMEPVSYFLALQRLAPVQCVSWGHPVTSGMPEIDYYVSSAWLEPPAELAQRHYTERLVLLPELPMLISRPQAGALRSGKEALGISTDAHVYVCPQSLFKLHPDFDPIISEILRLDRDALLLLFSGEREAWDRQLLARFERTLRGGHERVMMLPKRSREEFVSVLASADVMLDTPHFGGGNTTLDALSVGTPIVTIEGPRMSGRLTAGLLRRIGATETIVTSAEAYVSAALRLGLDPELRAAVRNHILRANHVLYDNHDAVRALEDFLGQVVPPV